MISFNGVRLGSNADVCEFGCLWSRLIRWGQESRQSLHPTLRIDILCDDVSGAGRRGSRDPFLPNDGDEVLSSDRIQWLHMLMAQHQPFWAQRKAFLALYEGACWSFWRE